MIVRFQEIFLAKHQQHVVNNNLHRRRTQTVNRELALSDIIDIYIDKDFDEQIDSFLDTALQIGNLGKLKDAEKIINESLCDTICAQ